jgi:hypothetical protein
LSHCGPGKAVTVGPARQVYVVTASVSGSQSIGRLPVTGSGSRGARRPLRRCGPEAPRQDGWAKGTGRDKPPHPRRVRKNPQIRTFRPRNQSFPTVVSGRNWRSGDKITKGRNHPFALFGNPGERKAEGKPARRCDPQAEPRRASPRESPLPTRAATGFDAPQPGGTRFSGIREREGLRSGPYLRTHRHRRKRHGAGHGARRTPRQGGPGLQSSRPGGPRIATQAAEGRLGKATTKIQTKRCRSKPRVCSARCFQNCTFDRETRILGGKRSQFGTPGAGWFGPRKPGRNRPGGNPLGPRRRGCWRETDPEETRSGRGVVDAGGKHTRRKPDRAAASWNSVQRSNICSTGTMRTRTS